jgi:hypothetical protein
MAPPVYSYQFISEASFTGAAVVEYPAGYVAIVRDIDVVAGVSASGSFYAYDVGTGGKFWAVSEGVETLATWSWRGRQVFEPGNQIGFFCDFELDVRMSGYLLSAGP